MSLARKPETLASIAGLSPLPGPPDNTVLLGPYVGFIPALASLEGETVLTKTLPNAFAATTLAAAIAATRCRRGGRRRGARGDTRGIV